MNDRIREILSKRAVMPMLLHLASWRQAPLIIAAIFL